MRLELVKCRVLEVDHAFSEKHNIEYALWQLHYKRIEELRTYFNAAHTSVSSKSSLGGKGSVRPDRITKIRLQFKTFLSEATGFYHDLIMNIRAKYGLPLGYFEDSENKIVMGKDEKKSSDMKKGLISCHRCLIYLGDLARYKGLYGGGDSKKHEYAAASSYYLQAATIWPSSGNPYHQLALLASYNEDELTTVYCYFRSLAVDSPFSTTRDNLILAFEKNRQSYSKLSGDVKEHAVNGMGKGEAKLVARDTGLKRSPISRPSRHLGPPPGFSHVSLKQDIEPSSPLLTEGKNGNMCSYYLLSWDRILDIHQVP
ncbi:Protein SMG7 SMG7-like protein [Vigna angularis]|uniref:Protein SMG7 SMG7-like protein n=1 Tax=Phaseolus angularis TaxID=3914 RepID=A0A8T0JUT4_PHAAN|nr:Protein SMG7 SMG7-like protein [Vigna angularis]